MSRGFLIPERLKIDDYRDESPSRSQMGRNSEREDQDKDNDGGSESSGENKELFDFSCYLIFVVDPDLMSAMLWSPISLAIEKYVPKLQEEEVMVVQNLVGSMVDGVNVRRGVWGLSSRRTRRAST